MEFELPPQREIRRWEIVGLLFASSFINYLDRAALSVALPMISVEFGLSPFQKGALLWSFFPSYALMQLPIGWLADRFNLKWFYAALFTLWSLSCGLTGFAKNLLTLLLLRVLLGIGESVSLPAALRIVSSLFKPQDRGLPSGLFDCGTRVGLTVGTPLIAWLVIQSGWRTMFVLVGFLAMIWLLPWLLLFPAHLSATVVHIGSDSRVSALREGRAITLNRNLLGLCLGFFCFGYYWYLLVTWLPDYFVRVRHMSIFKAGIYASLPYLIFAASEPLGGWIADCLIRLGWNETLTRKAIVTIAFSMGLMLIPAAYVASTTQAIALMAGASLVGLATGNLLVILQSCAPQEEVGAWTGIENFAGNVGGISALVTGYLVSRTGSYFPGFLLASVILFVGQFAYWFVVGALPSATSDTT